MRYKSPDSILIPSGDPPEVSPGQVEGDFLTRVNLTIENIKELLKMAGKFRGEKEKEEGSDPPAKLNPGPKTPGVSDYIQLAIKAGYGDIAIGKLIEQISPHTLNKIMEIFKNARFKQ